MKSSKLAAILSLCLTVGMLTPALADDEKGLNQAVDSSMMVERVGGMGAGMVLGTPVAVMRDTASCFVKLTTKCADHIGGHNFGPSCVLASVVTAPCSLVYGGTVGLYHACKNGMSTGFGAPFSAASFSLGDKYKD